jgi:hypothetical protein
MPLLQHPPLHVTDMPSHVVEQLCVVGLQAWPVGQPALVVQPQLSAKQPCPIAHFVQLWPQAFASSGTQLTPQRWVPPPPAHPHVPGPEAALHVCPPLQVPQFSVVHPMVDTVPQLSPIGQLVGHIVLTHWPEPLQVSGAVHDPQSTMPPQPSEASPQTALPHAWAFVRGVHMHVPADPTAALHVFGAAHVPQATAAHPGVDNDPQSSPMGQLVGHIVLTHWPALLQVSGEVHDPQFTMLPQPSGAEPHLAFPQGFTTGMHMHVPAPLQW